MCTFAHFVFFVVDILAFCVEVDFSLSNLELSFFSLYVPYFQFHRGLPVPRIQAGGEHCGKPRSVPHLFTEKIAAVERDGIKKNTALLP